MIGLKAFPLALTALALCFTSSHQQRFCVDQLDLVLMVDASNSVYDNNFRNMMNGLSSLTRSLDVGPEKIRIGNVVFSSTVLSSPITGNKQQVLNDISKFEYLDESTRTDLGLQEAMNLFRKASRSGNVPKLLIVITDGASTKPAETLAAANQAKALGISIYAIGISDAINEQELRALASSPKQVMLTPDFNNIDKVIRDAVNQACTQIIIPTTTTPRPATTPRSVPMPHQCSNSGSETTGIGYAPHTSECDRFIQCYYDAPSGFHLGVVRRCPQGMYYDRQTKDCDWPTNVTCPYERCQAGCATYPMSSTLRGYWECRGQVSYGMCCPEYHTFIPNVGCVKVNCNEPCSVGNCGMGKCTKRPVWGIRTMYQYRMEHVNKNSWIPAVCPNNELNIVDCDCTASTDHYCSPDFDTTFTSATTLGNYVTANGVTFGPSGATVGQGRLLHINLHKNMGYEPITLRLVYRETVTPGAEAQILISSSHNCPYKGGMLKVIYNQDQIKVTIYAKNNQMAWASIPMKGLTSNLLTKDLMISYFDRYLVMSLKVGSVQFLEKVVAPTGILFPCGLDIGPTQIGAGFSGTIQRLSVYSCAPSKFY